MTTLADTKFNHAHIVPAASGAQPVSEIIVNNLLDDSSGTGTGVGTDHAWGARQPAVHENVTRPHADGVATNNNDPDSMGRLAGNADDNRLDSKAGAGAFIAPDNGPDVFVRTIALGASGSESDNLHIGDGVAIDDIYDGTSSTFVDGIDRNGNNVLATRNGGEVTTLLHGDFSSYVTNGTTGTVSDSGNDAKITDITDGTSNTALDASSKDAGFIFGRTDGSAASNAIEALAEKYTMFDGEADGLLVGGAGGAGSLGLLAGGAGGAGSIVSAAAGVPPVSEIIVNNLLDDSAGAFITPDNGPDVFVRTISLGAGKDRGIYTMFDGEADGLVVGGAGGAGSIELVEHESATRPHADGALLLHGDFSSLVDTDAAIAAATEELFGNYNFLRIEPTSSEVDSGVKSRFADEGLIGDTGDSLVATALLHGDFSSLAENDAGGNEAKIVGFVDGTSNTVAFAENNVVENVNVKYTFSGAEDDPLAGPTGSHAPTTAAPAQPCGAARRSTWPTSSSASTPPPTMSSARAYPTTAPRRSSSIPTSSTS